MTMCRAGDRSSNEKRAHTTTPPMFRSNKIQQVSMAPLLLLMLMIPLFAIGEEGSEAKIPPAFPQWDHKTEPAPTPKPIATPPGMKSTPEARSYAPPASPQSSAAWLLNRMADTDSPELRRRAAEVWPLDEEDEKSLLAIIRGLLDPVEAVRLSAQQRLNAIDDSALFAYVMRTFSAGTVDETKHLNAALPVLAQRINPFLLETLRTTLETHEHKRIAVYCLGQTRESEAAPLLFPMLGNDDPAMAKLALDALYSIMPSGSSAQWMKILDHQDAYFKVRAVRALAFLQEPGSFDLLKQICLGQRYTDMQMTALRAISWYPDDILIPLLVEIMERNRGLSGTAVQLLRQRTGMDFGNSPRYWREWLQKVTQQNAAPLVPVE
ncbi:MAG: hypothetical protein GX117_09035 [Candidatus Hydrogenedentes bacterium]|nr:hypothetical protein [Candidatus Hydrogenedentota bacterium]